MYFIIGRFEALKVAVGGEQVCVGGTCVWRGRYVCVCVAGVTRPAAPRRPRQAGSVWLL